MSMYIVCIVPLGVGVLLSSPSVADAQMLNVAFVHAAKLPTSGQFVARLSRSR